IKIGGVVEVDVEEVIGGRQAAPGPLAGVGVEALVDLDADLEEVGVPGRARAQLERVEGAALTPRAVLGADAEAEARQAAQAVEEAGHGQSAEATAWAGRCAQRASQAEMLG